MHGAEDCSIGRIQLCAINHLQGDPDAQMEFVACQMRFENDQTGEECASELNIPFSVITECYNSGLGEELQLQAEVTTNNLRNPLPWVPTVAYNWVYEHTLNERSEYSLQAVICEQLNAIPEFCQM